MPLGMEIGLGPSDFVLDGDPAPLLPPHKGGGAPQFSAHVYCGQTAGWIKVALGMEGPRSRPHFARWGPSYPPQRRWQSPPPIFGPFLLWPNGWMHQDVTWYGGRPQPRRLCVRWGPSSPSQKGDRAPSFRPMCIVAKRLDGTRCYLVRR